MTEKEKAERWEKMFLELVDYRGKRNHVNAHDAASKFGDCNVPSTQDSKNPYAKLYTWCDHQRSRHRSGTLASHKVQRLTAVGFSWKGAALDAWEVKFQELEAFRTHHGHCSVPQLDGALGNWVKKLRSSYAKKSLPQHKIDRLNAIGFVWRVREARNLNGITCTPAKRRPSSAAESVSGESEPAQASTNGAAPDDGEPSAQPGTAAPAVEPTVESPAKASKRPAAAMFSDAPATNHSSPRKRRAQSASMSVACTAKLVQTFTEVSGEGAFQDWVQESLSFLEGVVRARKVHQQTCLQMTCTLQAQLRKWHDALAECRRELLDLTQPPSVRAAADTVTAVNDARAVAIVGTTLDDDFDLQSPRPTTAANWPMAL